MAYQPVNKLRRVLMVQDVYRKYSEEGVTDIFIYENYIKDVFLISKRTFYTYLATPAKRELQRLEN